MLWELILDVLDDDKSPNRPPANLNESNASQAVNTKLSQMGAIGEVFKDVDYVPFTMPMSTGLGRLVILEDNQAVIKMCIKGRSPSMRCVGRTHRVNLDWLWERVRRDPGIWIKYCESKSQITNMFTKGRFITHLYPFMGESQTSGWYWQNRRLMYSLKELCVSV